MITEGVSDPENFEHHKDSILSKIVQAAESGLRVVQIREKRLPAGLLADLVESSVEICRESGIAVLVNDRFDIAVSTGAAGVQLTAKSIAAGTVRAACPDGFIIGVSAHSKEEVIGARDAGADFVLFGPVFDSPAKRRYGKPQGTALLADICRQVAGFPVVAVGGIDESNIDTVLQHGAAGYAAIRMFNRGTAYNQSRRSNE